MDFIRHTMVILEESAAAQSRHTQTWPRQLNYNECYESRKNTGQAREAGLLGFKRLNKLTLHYKLPIV